MDARSGDARARRSALRTRLLRHSTVADALDGVPEPPPPPPRRVAGHRPDERRAAVAAQAHAPEAAPPVRAPITVEPAGDDLIPFRTDEPRPPRAPSGIARRMIVAGCAVAVLGGAGAAGYFVLHRPAHHHQAAAPSTSRPPAPAGVRPAEAWVRANLPRSAKVHSDATVSADLRAGGYSAAGLYTSIDALGSGSFLVTTPGIRDRAAQGWAAAAQRIAPLRVAAFGTGQGQVDVTLLIGGSATALSDRLARDDRERRAADEALLDNPRVAVDAAGRSWLADGRVDLRAATIVALLASRTDVTLTRVSADAGERAADRPARSIALRLGDPAALGAVLRALPATYLPARTTVLPSGERQLTWTVGLAPAGL